MCLITWPKVWCGVVWCHYTHYRPVPPILIKWCTKDLSLCLVGRLSTLRPSAAVITLDEKLTSYLPLSLILLLSPCFCGLLFEHPQFHSGRAVQMQDDPVISVWLLMLRKAFSDRFLSQFSYSEQTIRAKTVIIICCFTLCLFYINVATFLRYS